MGAVPPPPWSVKACSYNKTPLFVLFQKGRRTLRAVGLLKTRSRASQVHAKTDHCTMHSAVRADEPSSNAVRPVLFLRSIAPRITERLRRATDVVRPRTPPHHLFSTLWAGVVSPGLIHIAPLLRSMISRRVHLWKTLGSL